MALFRSVQRSRFVLVSHLRNFSNIIMGTQMFPIYVQGEVVKGFGRGSKELGIPTANFKDVVVEKVGDKVDCGIYYGWANVDQGPVYGMVMSVGWNPFYKNTKKTMETHLLHTFPEDFYGSHLKLCICGYIREMRNFASVDELIEAINNDIACANENLKKTDTETLKQSDFFTEVESR